MPQSEPHSKASSKKTVASKPTHKASGKASTTPHSTSQQKSVANDIVSLVLADHKPIKKLIKILKNTDRPFSERKAAFKEFAPLLAIHAKSEEETWYVQMKKGELRQEGLEGDVEHGLADQMLEEAKRTDDQDLWSARVKVLAELVEHHIEEEEEEILPSYKKAASAQERAEVGTMYLEAKKNVKPDGSETNPSLNVEVHPAVH